MAIAVSEIEQSAPPGISPAGGSYLADPAELAAAGRTRDGATLIGLGTGFVLLIGAILVGGSLAAYADLPAFLVVFGGTAAVTSISFPSADVRRVPEIIGTTLMQSAMPPAKAALRLVQLAERARRQGLLSLEAALPHLRDDRLLIKALALVVDNGTPDDVERSLRAELQATQQRHRAAADILRRGGEVAPAMGLIGTLIGLVEMLANLSNPSAIGPAMAVAILATLYGAVLANMVLLPLASKLHRNAQVEALIGNLTIMTASAIAAHENPRRLEVMLNGILPPADRISFFD